MTRDNLTNKNLFRLLNLVCCLLLLSTFQKTTHAQNPAISLTTNSPMANSSSVVGQWAPPVSWPLVAIHTSLLPNGKVLIWSRDKDSQGNDVLNKTLARVWDPATGAFTSVTNSSTNLFCSGHSFLPDGRLLVTGGHHLEDAIGERHTNIFDYRNNSWVRGPDMNAGRWYPTNCALGNGEVLIASGTDENKQLNKLPQVWQTAGSLRSLTGAAAQTLPLYPWLLLAPNGKVFNPGPDRATRFLSTAGNGSWTPGPTSNFGFRDYGSSVMYDDGKVLIVGGGTPTNTAEVVNLSWNTPAWRSIQAMAFARRQMNATILADGKVLVTGGTTGGGFNNATGSVLAAEIWDPTTERWTTVASMQVRRIYHSTAILLPDGRVLSGGGGFPTGGGSDTNHLDVEIYSPPYLFNGARPTITTAPTIVQHGGTFTVSTPNPGDIAEVTFVKLSSVTHAFNENHRINYLSFTPASGTNLNVTAPGSSNLCPPGHYMMFLINRNGVPSIAKIIQVTVPPQPLNAIIDSRFFVRQHYYDLLNREPDKPGLQNNTRVITACGNNIPCIEQKRVEAARGFWDSAEFKQKFPAVVSPSGNPAFNNTEFVKLCYRLYLRREPSPAEVNVWLSQLNQANDYNAVIKGFITSTEYRARFGQP
jgi:hypothetical protein